MLNESLYIYEIVYQINANKLIYNILAFKFMIFPTENA